MDIDEEIRARIRAAKAWDRQAKLEDFQVSAAENGFVLINLKTRRAQLIYDEDSDLPGLKTLFQTESENRAAPYGVDGAGTSVAPPDPSIAMLSPGFRV